MIDSTKIELNPIEKQQKLIKIIEEKAKKTHSMISSFEKEVEQDILEYLIMMQSDLSSKL